MWINYCREPIVKKFLCFLRDVTFVQVSFSLPVYDIPPLTKKSLHVQKCLTVYNITGQFLFPYCSYFLWVVILLHPVYTVLFMLIILLDFYTISLQELPCVGQLAFLQPPYFLMFLCYRNNHYVLPRPMSPT